MINFEIFAENLIIHELLHLFFAILASVFIYWKYKSWKLVFIAIFVSFLIDVDHFFEGFLIYGFNLMEILKNFRGNYFKEAGVITVFFHSWEFLPVILYLGKKYRFLPLAISIVAGAAAHYFTDNLVYSTLNNMPILEYSLIFRILNGFDFYKLCGQ